MASSGSIDGGYFLPLHEPMYVKIDQRYKTFIKELPDDAERGLLLTLYDNPLDKAARDAYHDWLIEKGRNKTAKSIKKGWTPGVEKK